MPIAVLRLTTYHKWLALPSCCEPWPWTMTAYEEMWKEWLGVRARCSSWMCGEAFCEHHSNALWHNTYNFLIKLIIIGDRLLWCPKFKRSLLWDLWSQTYEFFWNRKMGIVSIERKYTTCTWHGENLTEIIIRDGPRIELEDRLYCAPTLHWSSFSACRHYSTPKVPQVVSIANSLGDRLKDYGDLLRPKTDLLQIWTCEEGICLIISDTCSPCDGKSTWAIQIEISLRVVKSEME